MRIAYVCADRGIPVLGTKGASVHMRSMAGALAHRGHEVHVACAAEGEGGGALAAELWLMPREEQKSEAWLAQFLATHRIDAVLERYSLTSGAAGRVARQAGIPLVLEVNAPLVLEAARFRGLQDVEAGLERERRIFASADAVVVVSRALEEYVAARTQEGSVHRVPNGVDIDLFGGAPEPLELPRARLVVGFAGSMKPWHGVDDLLTAFCAIAAARDDVDLILVGSGPEEVQIRNRASSPPLKGRVSLLGGRPHAEMPGILAAMDVAVAPYRPMPDFYFSPLKVLEYMAAGVATVYPSLGDLPETVGDAGIPYPAGDGAALTDAISRLIDDPALRRRLGEAGRVRARTFAWDVAAARVEAVIEHCFLSRSRTAR